MGLVVKTPNGYAAERSYILGVLLGEFLGVSWRHVVGPRQDVSITLESEAGEIRMPDGLFSRSEATWLSAASMPPLPLPQWDTRDLNDDINLVDPVLPVVYGDRDPRTVRNGNTVGLPVDLFGTAFFMLSRYEELVMPSRDDHDRFPARASTAFNGGFLERPIVDEYVEVLWAAMKSLWPRLERRKHSARFLVSCDVDNPVCFRGQWQDVVRRIGDDLLAYRSPRMAAWSAVHAWRARNGNFRSDPDWSGLQWIMEVNERAGNTVAFHLIPETTNSEKDKSLSLDDPRMRALLRQIGARGHEVGVHPGYDSYRDLDVLSRSLERFNKVLDDEGIAQSTIGSRQHFLRWETPTTARLLDQCGLDYDTTLSFADMPGFRCGTCREHPLFDLERRTELRLRERPLVLMECTILATRYLNLGYTDEALARMLDLKQTCHRFGGNFTVLWHNSYFRHPKSKMFYRALIGDSS